MEELELHLADMPNKCSAGDGLTWVRAAWGLFKRRWGTWMLMVLVMFLLTALSSAVWSFWAMSMSPQAMPVMLFLSSSAGTLLGTFLAGGMLVAAASLAEEDDLRFIYLFAGFQYKFMPLLVLGVLLMLLSLLLSLLLLALLPESWLRGGVWLLIYAWPMWFCGVFAVSLVVLHDVAPHRAIGMSIRACLRNWLPILVSGFVWLLLVLGVSIVMILLSVGLGAVLGKAAGLLFFPVVLALLAVMLLFNYTCYRNVWTNLPMQ